MLARVLTEGAFSALSMLFGGLGIFFLYLSCFVDSALSAYALIFLGSATSIVFSQQHGAWKRKR